MNIKNKRGITLIALIITIVILLILAGITISALTGENGLFTRAQQAKKKTVEGQIREEIIMAIQDIQAEELPKGNNVTLETLVDGQLESKLKDITAELKGNEINGEYKDYEYMIDSNLNVIINGTVTGGKITGSAEVQTEGYVFEGSTVEIKVTASITEGAIAGIEAPKGATIKTDTSATEKVYTVNKNGTYVFKIISDSGKTKKVIAIVKNILGKSQIKIEDVTYNSFKIIVENDYPEGAIIEYKYYVDGTVKQQGTADKSCVVTGLKEETEYNNIKVVACVKGYSYTINGEKVKTRMKDEILYSWDEIAEIAKAISNNNTITDNSEIATVNVDGIEKTLKVGQVKRLDGKKVRILGFNHDTLAEPNTAYESSTATGKAGISFEYVDYLILSARMKSSDNNAGGWEKTELRGRLNSTEYNLLSIKNNIKKVIKEFIPTYNIASTKTTEDYLWLLSCGEVWNNGNVGGTSRGYAITTEGKQYKYYKINLKNTLFSSTNNVSVKPSINDALVLWLRSPNDETEELFCNMGGDGHCDSNYASAGQAIFPGFSI